MIRNYDDITTIDRYEISSENDVHEYIQATDLRAEALAYLTDPDYVGGLTYLRAGAYNEEALEILYFPESGRAGVAWGADAQWTDADSADDALEHYFGVDDKDMIP